MRIGQFYDGDPRSRDSDEVPFGDGWRSATRKGSWNVFWIRDTGELVAYQTARSRGWSGVGTAFGDMVMAAVNTSIDHHDAEVDVLAIDTDEGALRATLTGWEQQVGTPDGFTWLLGVTGRSHGDA